MSSDEQKTVAETKPVEQDEEEVRVVVLAFFPFLLIH